jgi:hypothetical protein
MFEIRLDRSYYSISAEIFKHLKEQFGLDKDHYTPWEGMEVDSKFFVRQDFGYTTVSFIDEADAKKFQDWVEKQ